jgi:hypothetical protein
MIKSKAVKVALSKFQEYPIILLDKVSQEIMGSLYPNGIPNRNVDHEKFPYEKFILILEDPEDTDMATVLQVKNELDMEAHVIITASDKMQITKIAHLKILLGIFSFFPDKEFFKGEKIEEKFEAIKHETQRLSALLLIIMDLMEMDPTVIVKQKAERKFSASKTHNRNIPEHFKLNLTERKVYRYNEKEKNGEKRRSPCMHIRRAHFKNVHTRAGTIRKLVKQTIVCKGNEPASNVKILR